MKPNKTEKKNKDKDKKKKGKKGALSAPVEQTSKAVDKTADGDRMSQAMAVIGGRWKLRVLWALSDGEQRYSNVKRTVTGITDVMLSQSLKELTADGLVNRCVSSEEPVRIIYSLTEKGQALIPALELINDWANRYHK